MYGRNPNPAVGNANRPPNHHDVYEHRQISNYQPFRKVSFHGRNTYIPSFGMMFNILSAMNDKLIQTLRAQRIAHQLESSQSQWLSYFEDSYSLDHITIPGPLVPFFRAISVCNPGTGNFSDVSPAIPVLSIKEESLYNLNIKPDPTMEDFEGLTMMLPNLPLMIDQFCHLMSYLSDDTRKYSDYEQLRKIFGVSRPADGSRLSPHFDRLLKSVGFWTRPFASDGLMRRFASHIRHAHEDFPRPFSYEGREDQWTRIDDFFSYTQMKKSLYWFQILFDGMHTFNKHWKGDCSLGSLNPKSSKAGLILFKQVSIKQFHDDSASSCGSKRLKRCGGDTLNHASHYLEYESKATSTCPYLELEDKQDAQIAQLNIICDEDTDNNRRIGDIGVTRFGNYWSVNPDVCETNRVNLTQVFQSMATSYKNFMELDNSD